MTGDELVALPVYKLKAQVRTSKPQAIREAIEAEQRKDAPRRSALALLERELRVRYRLAAGRA